MTDHRRLELLQNQALTYNQTAFVRISRSRRFQSALHSLYALLLEVMFGSRMRQSEAG